MTQISQSRFWDPLWKQYSMLPSIVLCRVPELEYASALDVSGSVLDHCCGDGRFASLAWPGRRLTAGCDIDGRAMRRASGRGIYTHLDVCDANQCLPYKDGVFDLVVDNSALEHMANLNAALCEVARVLAPGGLFAFNVLNHRFFEWWTIGSSAMREYRQWQPFYHALTLAEWKLRLLEAGLEVVSVVGYFGQEAAGELARLDCAFSSVGLAGRHSWLVWWYRRSPRLMSEYWRWRLSSLTWETEPDAGAGYSIRAVKASA